MAKTKRPSDEELDILIEGLQRYKNEGVIDPWILSDNRVIEPLAVLEELRELRKKLSLLEPSPFNSG